MLSSSLSLGLLSGRGEYADGIFSLSYLGF